MTSKIVLPAILAAVSADIAGPAPPSEKRPISTPKNTARQSPARYYLFST